AAAAAAAAAADDASDASDARAASAASDARAAGAARRFVEDDPLGGSDPYSSSKACAELVVAAYRSSYFSGAGDARVASARAGSVIGGGDWGEDRLLADAVRAIAAGEPMR